MTELRYIERKVLVGDRAFKIVKVLQQKVETIIKDENGWAIAGTAKWVDVPTVTGDYDNDR